MVRVDATLTPTGRLGARGKPCNLGSDAQGSGEDRDRLGLSDRWAAGPTPVPRAAGPSPQPTPHPQREPTRASDLGQECWRPGWSWEPAAESSCGESWPWSSFNYDRNVSLGLFGPGQAKSPFLAALLSQPGLCQAAGLGWGAPGFAWWVLRFVGQVNRAETLHISEEGLAGSQGGEACGGDAALKRGVLLWKTLSLGWRWELGCLSLFRALELQGCGGVSVLAPNTTHLVGSSQGSPEGCSLCTGQQKRVLDGWSDVWPTSNVDTVPFAYGCGWRWVVGSRVPGEVAQRGEGIGPRPQPGPAGHLGVTRESSARRGERLEWMSGVGL